MMNIEGKSTYEYYGDLLYENNNEEVYSKGSYIILCSRESVRVRRGSVGSIMKIMGVRGLCDYISNSYTTETFTISVDSVHHMKKKGEDIK